MLRDQNKASREYELIVTVDPLPVVAEYNANFTYDADENQTED